MERMKQEESPGPRVPFPAPSPSSTLPLSPFSLLLLAIDPQLRSLLHADLVSGAVRRGHILTQSQTDTEPCTAQGGMLHARGTA